MSERAWMNRAQAAEYVGATVRGFDWWVSQKGIRAAGRRGRVRLFSKEQLDRVLKSDATRTSQGMGNR